MAHGDYLKPGQRCYYCGKLITFGQTSTEDQKGHPWHASCAKKYLKDPNGNETLKKLRKDRGQRTIIPDF